MCQEQDLSTAWPANWPAAQVSQGVIMYYENPKGVAVHDGFPNAATDASIQTLDLNKLLIKNSVSTYYMRASGDEWQPYGIHHNDILLIDRAVNPGANDLVVWWQEETFRISPRHKAPIQRQVWGTICAVIRQLRGEKA